MSSDAGESRLIRNRVALGSRLSTGIRARTHRDRHFCFAASPRRATLREQPQTCPCLSLLRAARAIPRLTLSRFQPQAIGSSCRAQGPATCHLPAQTESSFGETWAGVRHRSSRALSEDAHLPLLVGAHADHFWGGQGGLLIIAFVSPYLQHRLRGPVKDVTSVHLGRPCG